MQEVISSVIVAVLAMIGTIVGSSITSNKNLAVMQTQFESFKEKIEQQLSDLKKSQDKHNNMIERMYKVEGRVTELEHDIRDLKEVK